MEFGLLIVPLSIGLFSSFSHCIGMCGPLSLALTSHSGISPLKSNAFFQLGRLSTYVMLGAVGGILGEVIHVRLNTGLSQIFIAALSLFYLVFAFSYLIKGSAAGEKTWSQLIPGFLKPSNVSNGLVPSSYILGMSAGALPCPSTYAVLIWSLSVPHFFLGALGMFSLWAITLPAFGVSMALKKVPGLKGRTKNFVLGFLFLGLAAWNGAGLLGIFHPGCLLHH